MNAPETIQTMPAQLLPLSAIAISKTNPRKTFNQAGLAELAGTIKDHGVLQPILVRPMPQGESPYELVAGERRFRAAKTAGLIEIPAMVRDLTDAQALELQVIENLQREDLHPLEEADGYQALIKKHAYAVDDLAAKVGKSKAFIYGRMKLCSLGPGARNFFLDGKLSASTALLIARIPVAELQAKAAKEVATGNRHGFVNGSGEPMSYRDAADHLQRNYMLTLTEAVFDIKDATLQTKAGACGDCPKRTGNQPELFSDVARADVCTDPVCFGSKRTAHFDRLRANAIAKGQTIIEGKKAKEIFRNEWGGPVGYAELGSKLDYQDRQTVGQLAKKVGLATVLVEKPKTGDLVELVDPVELKAALRKAGLLKPKQKGDNPNFSAADNARVRADKEKQKVRGIVNERVLVAFHAKANEVTSLGIEDLRTVASLLWDMSDYDVQCRLVELNGWHAKAKGKAAAGALRTSDGWADIGTVQKRIAELSVNKLCGLVLCLAISEDVVYSGSGKNDLFDTAKRHGVDVAQIKKEIAAELKAAAPKKAPAKTAKKPTKKPAARKAKA